jgi:radical SAM protein with 4Fe4S-binding SPASM domain
MKALKSKQDVLTNNLNFLWLELTEKCNLTCNHCYANSSPRAELLGTMSYNDWHKTMKEAYATGCRNLQFIGGEPTMHPNFLDLLIDAKSIGFQFIEVYTNGTLLTDTHFNLFKELNIALAFSIYGNEAHIHDFVTNRKGSFNKTIKSIERAIELDLKIRIGIVEMDVNKDYVDNTKTFLINLGASNISIDRVRGIGRGNDFVKNENKYSELCGACWNGKLSVDANGNIYPCVFSRFHKVGTVSDGISNILSSPSLRSFRSDSKLFSEKANIENSCKPNCDPSVCDPSICDPSYCDPSKCDPSYF